MATKSSGREKWGGARVSKGLVPSGEVARTFQDYHGLN
ncbi:MAG: hypothetical protein ACI8T1_002524 [Verrucomicrobiales bacterium]|jgi:hypothetical protein